MLVTAIAALRRTLLVCVVIAGNAWAQTTGDPQLQTLASELEQARAQNVPVLSPQGYARAAESYAAAQEDANRGRNPDRLRKRVVEALETLRTAVSSAEQARESFSTVVRTRNDALAAEPAKYAPQTWTRAEERFVEAMRRRERGDEEAARKRAAEAEVLIREAELEAIKARLLGKARALLAQAEEQDVAEVAPRTLGEAQRLLAQADQEITRSRYDLTLPQSLTREAEYEAEHALHLAQVIRQVLEQEDDDQHGLEALLLSYEAPLQKVAAEVDTTVRFNESAVQAIESILAQVQTREQEFTRVRQELEDRTSEVAALTKEVQRLEQRLGGVSEERLALQRRVAEQEALRANAAAIESSFSPGEARVYRQGEDIVISLTGINFGVGRSTVAAASEPLLKKVQESIARFPDAPLVVEGHTDANGTDSANLLLSQDRADAVKEYLVRNAGVNPEKITSIGYGESRPVASNETNEGRARNRRIDLIIRVGR
jgi:OOP family OmpA-OmpF porin